MFDIPSSLSDNFHVESLLFILFLFLGFLWIIADAIRKHMASLEPKKPPTGPPTSRPTRQEPSPPPLPEKYKEEHWPIKVLVLDDEPTILSSFDMILGLKFIDHELALRGEDVLRLMEKEDFDLAFFDSRFVGMTCEDLLKAAKAIRPETEYVVVTVGFGKAEEDRYRKLGVLGIMHKPFTIEAIYEYIEKAYKIREKKGLIKKPFVPPIEDFVKDGKFTFGVVGVGYENREENVKYVKEGDTVILRREPNNPHDKNAIKVLIRNGKELGYVPREFAEQIAPKMNNEIEAVLIKLATPESKTPQITLTIIWPL